MAAPGPFERPDDDDEPLPLDEGDVAGKPPDELAARLEALRSGDKDAFLWLMETYGHVVRGVVARRFQGPFDREEVEQEVWVHIFQHRHLVDPARAASFPGWLSTVSFRKCVDLRRRRREEGFTFTQDFSQVVQSPEQEPTTQNRELLQVAAEFMRRLPQQQREFFEMHFLQGLDYAEVGQRLGIGKLRCKYLKRVLAMRARRNRPLMEALGRLASTRKEGP
ncbi:MAG: sigma-70 family RNA polymerase sigma factor [Myxococcota bacterium]